MIALQATITCPHCDATARKTMPTDACQYFYECRACVAVLKPKPRGLLRLLLLRGHRLSAGSGKPIRMLCVSEKSFSRAALAGRGVDTPSCRQMLLGKEIVVLPVDHFL